MHMLIIVFGIALPILLTTLTSKIPCLLRNNHLVSFIKVEVCLSLTKVYCNSHLVSFIKVEGLFVSYIVDIFDTIKSKMTV